MIYLIKGNIILLFYLSFDKINIVVYFIGGFMNYGVILASGIGSRMKSINIPKQYFEIDGKPIIIYTLESMFKDDLFDYVYIAINKDYEELLLKYIDAFIIDEYLDKIRIIYGG